MRFDIEKTKEKFHEGEEKLNDMEIAGILGLLEAKEDRLMAIKNVVESIPDEYCTPIVKKNLELILSITK